MSEAAPERPVLADVTEYYDPRLRQVLARVAFVVELARTTANAELELRVGRLTTDAAGRERWQSSVPRAFVDEQIRRLLTNPQVRGRDWEELDDYFYMDGHGCMVRTRVTCNTDHLVVGREHCIKQPVYQVVVRTSHPDRYAFKIALSTETRVEPAQAVVAPSRVRIQQRRRFEYGAQPGRPDWAFEFSSAHMAATKTETERRQHSGDKPAEYAAEIELLGGERSAYLLSHDSSYVAASMLLKALDFAPADACAIAFETDARARHRPPLC